MKKEWKKPEIELLTVQMTMLGSEGDHTDATFDQGTPRGDVGFS
ncbi:paeninodin family lasso peptide [Jeotgalibacillus proteolyticus]